VAILRCTCAHLYQDSRYGKQMRVHNEGQNDKVSCTVCGKMISKGSSGKKKK